MSFNGAFRANNPDPLPISFIQFVAPFWADVDIRGTGQVFYRQTTDPDLLDRATSEIRAAYPAYKYFNITHLFIATWDRVGYFSRHSYKVQYVAMSVYCYYISMAECLLILSTVMYNLFRLITKVMFANNYE